MGQVLRGSARILPALVLAALLVQSPSIAAPLPADQPATVDHHAIVDADTYPWSSVGKLYNSIGGACTAAAVAPDKVLTAAHCLYAFRTGRFLRAEAIHFLLGYARGDYRIHARVASFGIGPGYDPKDEARTAGADWAVLTLAEPLPATVRPIALSPALPAPGSQIEIGGFAQDRAYLMTADQHCRFVGVLTGGRLLRHDCVIEHGDSGAPLLLPGTDGTVQAFGVTVGFATLSGHQIDIAAPVTTTTLPTAEATR